MPALALTDFCNLFGAVEFYKTCKEASIKPILGCEMMIAPTSRLEKKKIRSQSVGHPVVLLAKNKKGYQNLCKISSIAYIEGFYYTPRIDKETLEKHHSGLVCLTGSSWSLVSQLNLQGNTEEAFHEIQWLQDLFKEDFYFELLRHQMSEETIDVDGMKQESWLYQNYVTYIENQRKINLALLDFSVKLGVKTVATNDIHYIAQEDWKAHEVLKNVQSGEPCEIWERDSFGNPKALIPNPKRKVMPTHDFYFKSPAEMETLFADIPGAIATTGEIADKCNFKLDFKKKFYPVYTPPHLEDQEVDEETRVNEVEKFLTELCRDGIEKRYTKERLAKVKEVYPDEEPLDVIRKRLDYELDLIISKEMCDYLLIVYDFIAWAKREGIPVGPGRGSGAGSIILYLIGITDIEPLRFNLFFERFINPERVSYPDIDVDICMDRRAEVIEYTLKKYGKDKVAQIITFGTMKAKMAIKDVGRVLSVPLSKVNGIAKLVPEDLGMTLKKALSIDPDLQNAYETDEEAKKIIDFAKKLEGSIRNTGVHAAGLIICGDPLTDHIPVCNSKDAEMVLTQYSMKPVEAVGMLKIDFLGLKTLTSIQKAVDAIEKSSGNSIDWVNLPFDDAPTFDLLNQGKTLGIFQLESTGMQELARNLHIDTFEEIIAVGALYRPGPMEMIPSFINRKHGREKIESDHPLIEDIISETYGIMVYQEQVMQIASRLANYSLGEGDVLRRAMGKKDKKEMSKQRSKFREGALENNINEKTSMLLFDKIEKFASYGFNKSHAAAYGYLSYVTAYFKANYPREWMAALMTCDIDDISKVAKYIRECQAMGYPIITPDVNESQLEFVASPSGVRFAMSGIKGVGRGVVEAIIHEREQHGLFKSFNDFIKRIDHRQVGKKVIETMVDAGCFDFTEWSRGALHESLEPMFETAVREKKDKEKGVLDLFASVKKDEVEDLTPPETTLMISKQEMLKKEKEILGFYLTGHPMEEFEQLIKKLSCTSFDQFEKLDHQSVCKVVFIIDTVRIRITAKSQRKFAILTISDGMDRFELPVWPSMYEEKSHLFNENQLLYGVLQIEKDAEDVKLGCRWLEDLALTEEENLKECDDAFTLAKKQAKSDKMREKKMANQENQVSPEDQRRDKERLVKLLLSVNIDKIKLSHILQLKQIFYKYSGNTAVHLEFISENDKVGAVDIQSEWGIRLDAEFESKLRSLPFIRKHQLVDNKANTD